MIRADYSYSMALLWLSRIRSCPLPMQVVPCSLVTTRNPLEEILWHTHQPLVFNSAKEEEIRVFARFMIHHVYRRAKLSLLSWLVVLETLRRKNKLLNATLLFFLCVVFVGSSFSSCCIHGCLINSRPSEGRDFLCQIIGIRNNGI